MVGLLLFDYYMVNNIFVFYDFSWCKVSKQKICGVYVPKQFPLYSMKMLNL